MKPSMEWEPIDFTITSFTYKKEMTIINTRISESKSCVYAKMPIIILYQILQNRP
jgi:hypothetical protein